jgi:hypothetical protein
MTISDCVPDRGDEPGGVVVVESGDCVAEVDGDASGEAGSELGNASFAAGAGDAAAGPGGDGGVPVNGGHRGAVAGAVLDEPAGEVVAVQEGAVVSEEGDAGFEE